jgi:hypothetical protein
MCEDVARETTRRWAQAQAEGYFGADRFPEPVEAWITTWPLPVGAGPSGVPDSLLPLRLFAKAALILRPNIPFADVTAFGIVDDHPVIRLQTDGECDFVPTTMQFTTAGWLDSRVTKFQAWATKWWQGDNAFGRQRGKKYSRHYLIEVYLEHHAKLGRYPTQLQLATTDALRCSVRNISDIAGSWKQFKRDAEAYRVYRADFQARISNLTRDQRNQHRANRQITITD